MARQAQPIQNTPAAELKRAAKLAAQSGAAVPIYVDGVRLVISRANGAAPDTGVRKARPRAAAAKAEQDPNVAGGDRRPSAESALDAAGIKLPRKPTGRLTVDSPFWEIRGIAVGAGSENVSGNVDKYLLEAYADPDFHI